MAEGTAANMLQRVWQDSRLASFLLWSFLSNIGTWIQRITVGWMVFDLTSSAAWVGAIAACELVPSLLVAPYGGLLADRRDRFGLLAIGLLCGTGQAVMLAVLAATGVLDLYTLAAATAALGVIEGMNQPARLTVVSDVAPRALLPMTVSLNSLGFNGARFVGPIVASVALTGGSPAVAFLMNGISFVPLLVLMLKLQREKPPTMTKHVVAGGISAGLARATSHPVIGPILLLLVSVSLSARAMIELLPAIAGQWFGPSPADLARLSVSVAVGAMAGGIWMLFRRDARSVLGAVIAGPLGLAVIMVLFAWLGGEGWPAYLLLAGTGFLLLVSGSGTQSLIHLTADPDFRGRILAVFGIVQRAAPAIGALLLGLLGDHVGLGLAFVLAASCAACLWLWVWWQRTRLEDAL